MFKWIPGTYRAFVVWILTLQIKMFEKKEFRPLLVKWLEFKVGIINHDELQLWFTEALNET